MKAKGGRRSYVRGGVINEDSVGRGRYRTGASHAPFASIIVEWTPETVRRSSEVLDAVLDNRRS